MKDIKTGIIGGSGLYDLPDVKIIDEIALDTPFGNPSDKYTIIDLDGVKAAFLPRHGKEHRLLPGEIPVQANIYGFKSMGVNRLLAISAVGSLQEKIAPEHFVIPDQVIDRTKNRESTFFGNGLAGHISFADPFCLKLNKLIYNVLSQNNELTVHQGATYLCMEGPAFSTKAESNLYRSWGASVIGMTAIPECKLAREAEICYSLIAMSTDYDCWKENEEEVSVEMVIKHMQHNTAAAKKMLPELIKAIAAAEPCPHQQAARHAVLTDKKNIPAVIKEKLKIFYGDYL